MRTIFSCMWPSCTRNCDSLEEIEQHVRSHLGPKQFDSIGDEDFYYEETEVDEATYFAIFGAATHSGQHQGHRAAGNHNHQHHHHHHHHQAESGGNHAKSGGPLSPSHNSDGLSSGQSFASSSPATSPVCSSDSSQSSPSGNAVVAASVAAASGALLAPHHSSNSNSSSHHHHHAQQQQQLGRQCAGLEHVHHQLAPMAEGNLQTQQPAYWLSNSSNHHFHAQPQQQRQRLYHMASDFEAATFSRFRGLAASAYYASASAEPPARAIGRQRQAGGGGGSSDSGAGGGRRKKQRQEACWDEQPLQFSLELGACAASPPAEYKFGCRRNGQHATYGRPKKTPAAPASGDAQAKAPLRKPIVQPVATKQALQQAPRAPNALVDHTYNSPPPEDMNLAGGGGGGARSATSEHPPGDEPKGQNGVAATLASQRATRLGRGRRKHSLGSCCGGDGGDENEVLFNGRENYHLSSTKPKSQLQLQQQQQQQQQRRRLRRESAHGTAKRNNHLNHKIFHYQMPGEANDDGDDGGGGGGGGGRARGRPRGRRYSNQDVVDDDNDDKDNNFDEVDDDDEAEDDDDDDDDGDGEDGDRDDCNPLAAGHAPMMLGQGDAGAALATSANHRRVSQRNENRKCRKVYGMDRRDLWCTQCKWKKACSRFCDQ